MSLRLQLNLLVAALIAIFTMALIIFQVADVRSSVREETVAANSVAAKLLSNFIETHPGATRQVALQSLQRLGHVRSTDITLRDASGREIYHSPPPTYKAGRDAPAWYAAIVAPAPMQREFHYASCCMLRMQAVASRAVLDGWDNAVHLLQVGLFVLVLGNVLVFWLVGRTTLPFRTIVRGLEAIQSGAYHRRLPEHFRSAESRAIARAFNRAAAAIEENLDARRQAVEATLRLEQNRELAAIVQQRIEEDRRAIAQELHDETGQMITAIKSMAMSITITPEQVGVYAEVRASARLIADTCGALYDAINDLIPRLRPPLLDSLDLADALRERVACWQREQPGVLLVLTLGTLPDPLGESFALAAYRIVQEATTNALRHARPSGIEIELHSDARALHIEVRDDGVGLAPDWQRPGHYGVRGMRERARALGGELALENRDGGGTCLRARLALE